MYKKLLEQMRAEILAEATSPKKQDSLISKPQSTPTEQARDPLALSRDWIRTIKQSGEHFRSNIKPDKIKQQEEAQVEEQKLEQEAPIKEDESNKPFIYRPSMFDGEDSGEFSLQAYDGDENEVTSLVRQAAQKYGIPEDLFLRQMRQESGFNQSAKSSAGAIGVAQLMPGTARELGVNPFDLNQNIDGGARYLKQQYDTFGNWGSALAAYNAGPGAVQKYGGTPPYAETQNYVKSILGGG